MFCPLIQGLRRRTLRTGAAILLITAGSASGQETTVSPRPSLVVVTLSSVRSDRVRSEAGRNSRLPFLKSLGGKGALLDRARTPVPATLPALASLFSGLEPPGHGVYPNGRSASSVPWLIDRLTAAGYSSAVWSNDGQLQDQERLTTAFDSFMTHTSQRSLELVTRAAAAEKEKLARGNHFVWVHLGDAGVPYQPDEGDLAVTRQDTWNASWDFPLAVAGKPGVPHTLPPLAAQGALRQAMHYMDAYDAVLLGLDRSLELLTREWLPSLQASAGYLLIAGLHGEAMGEHDLWFHHGETLYEEELQVPVCLLGPGVRPLDGLMDSSWGSLTDLHTTLLSLLDMEPPSAGDGFNLAPMLTGSSSPPARYVVSGMDRAPYRRALLADKRFKLILTPARPRSEATNPAWPDKEQVQLFDLHLDPLESIDLSRHRGALAHELATYLRKHAPAWPGTPPAANTRRRR